jgi:hypothetical protein
LNFLQAGAFDGDQHPFGNFVARTTTTRPSQLPRPIAADWLVGGGELGALIRAKDWAATPLGPIEDWPQSLRSCISHLLPSKAQIVLFWGPDFVTLYNDAYRPVFGGKHPRALSLPGRESWSEVWDMLEPLLAGVVNTGDAFWARDLLFVLERNGYVEETYFDVSYDPVRDETGRVGGVFCIVSETTGRVVGERCRGKNQGETQRCSIRASAALLSFTTLFVPAPSSCPRRGRVA